MPSLVSKTRYHVFKKKKKYRLTVANTRGFAEDGSRTDTSVLDVLDVGDDLGAFVRHPCLTTRDVQLKVIVADLDVGRKKGMAAPSLVVARREPLGELGAGESEDLLVCEFGPAADDVHAISKGGLR